jgi:MFS family permease
LALFAKVDENAEAEVDVTLETEESSEDAAEEKMPEFKPLYAYFVLFMVLISRIIVMWHRAGLSYAYGYAGVGA